MKDNTKEALLDFINNPNSIVPSVHHNGYINIPFMKSYELHIWTSSLNKPNHSMRIHNHDWMTKSTTLYGTLHNTIYRRVSYCTPEGKSYELYDFDTLIANDYVVDLIIDKGRSKILTPGKYSTMMMGVYHSMWSSEPMSINLVSLLGTKAGDFIPKVAVPLHELPHRQNKMKGLHPSAIPLIVNQACNKIKHII